MSTEALSQTPWQRFQQLLELIRFSHTVFALPFALLTALLAWQTTEFRGNDLLGILLCMVFARSAAMAFNRIVDRDIDSDNPRTEGRHLPAGKLSLRLVIGFTIVCCAGFVLSTLLFLPNRWPLILSLPVLLFLLGYSYSKRVTSLCHYWLSAALMLSPIATWIAITGTLDWPPLMLAGMIFFWVGGFDIIYASQDADFDRDYQLFSIPSSWGIEKGLRIALISHILTIGFLFAFWFVSGLNGIFLAGVIAVSILLIYEHTLVNANDLSRVNVAFFNVNAMVSLGLLVLGIIDIHTLGPRTFWSWEIAFPIAG